MVVAGWDRVKSDPLARKLGNGSVFIWLLMAHISTHLVFVYESSVYCACFSWAEVSILLAMFNFLITLSYDPDQLI